MIPFFIEPMNLSQCFNRAEGASPVKGVLFVAQTRLPPFSVARRSTPRLKKRGGCHLLQTDHPSGVWAMPGN